MDHAYLWLKFLTAAGVVVAAGMNLTKNAEKLASAMNWGHAFAGFVVLGWATSLPEVTISLSAVQTVGSASLASGNITGSILFNLAILSGLDVMAAASRAPTDRRALGVMPLGVFNLVMLAGALLLAVWAGAYDTFGARALGVFLLALYVLSAVHAWRRQDDEPDESQAASEYGARRVEFATRCLAAGTVILFAGTWLAGIGDELASTYALEEGFVGTIFLATVSSLPELVTGVAAVRIGLLTMAAGSILGSNIFNLGVLGLCDLAYQVGDRAGTPLLVGADDPRMAWNLAAGLAMTVLILATLLLRRAGVGRRRIAVLFWTTMAIYLGALGAA